MQSIYDQLWGSALRLIQTRMMSRFELERKLKLRFPDENGLILKVLDEMERVELLNDRRYITQLVHHLTQRPIGRIKIMIEARKRGVDQEKVDGELINAGYDELEAAKTALAEKEERVHETDPRKRKFKLMSFLRSRGFTDATIYKLLAISG